MALTKKVGDSAGKHAGLSRPSAGNYKERSTLMRDRFALLWIEAL
jgi:hypothetical protein